MFAEAVVLHPELNVPIPIRLMPITGYMLMNSRSSTSLSSPVLTLPQELQTHIYELFIGRRKVVHIKNQRVSFLPGAPESVP